MGSGSTQDDRSSDVSLLLFLEEFRRGLGVQIESGHLFDVRLQERHRGINEHEDYLASQRTKPDDVDIRSTLQILSLPFIRLTMLAGDSNWTACLHSSCGQQNHFHD